MPEPLDPAGHDTLTASSADEVEVAPVPAGSPGAAIPVHAGMAPGLALSTRQLAWRRFRRHKLAMISAVVLIILSLAAIFAKLISPYGFKELDLLNAYKPPSLKHWFGTDELGRDEFTRVIYGGRISLIVGFSVAITAGVIGAIVGGLAGYYGGWLDNGLMRVTDLFLSIPFLVILI